MGMEMVLLKVQQNMGSEGLWALLRGGLFVGGGGGGGGGGGVFLGGVRAQTHLKASFSPLALLRTQNPGPEKRRGVSQGPLQQRNDGRRADFKS